MLLKCIALCSFSEVILVLFSLLMVLVDFKGYFQGQKGPIWTFVIYLGQYLGNGAWCDQCLCEAHIQSHIWSFSWPCDLWPWITFKGQIKVTAFQGVVSPINGASYDQSLYDIHIASHIWPFSLPYKHVWHLTIYELSLYLKTFDIG